jgi:hypothetical protein
VPEAEISPISPKQAEPEEEPSSMEASSLDPGLISSETSVAHPVAIQPEETAKEPESPELDQEIP